MEEGAGRQGLINSIQEEIDGEMAYHNRGNAEGFRTLAAQKALKDVNPAVVEAPSLALPDYNKPFLLYLGSGTSKAVDDSSASLPLAQLIKTANLAAANASEEDKIKAMMVQSCQEYDPINYMKRPMGPPPSSFPCRYYGKPGHYRRNCPTSGDKKFVPAPRMRRSTGIPRSFLIELKDPNTKGAMLTKTGKYAIPIINAEAYARGKKEKPPFVPEELPSSSSSSDALPDELLCLICKDAMTDAAVTPCCGSSYCDECIRTALLASEEHTCPACHQAGVSPDDLAANEFLRQRRSSHESRYNSPSRRQTRPGT
ncbi:E3 ubiquitin-protein ligase RBBP6-like, partial [Opisthocomus hoazin]|uniref:E3 ubiquitin-protein ligase RBBP6-like n=1 Tax=Opisthocomus hoazin TaxID=30419 RepID=UPI003F53D75C